MTTSFAEEPVKHFLELGKRSPSEYFAWNTIIPYRAAKVHVMYQLTNSLMHTQLSSSTMTWTTQPDYQLQPALSFVTAHYSLLESCNKRFTLQEFPLLAIGGLCSSPFHLHIHWKEGLKPDLSEEASRINLFSLPFFLLCLKLSMREENPLQCGVDLFFPQDRSFSSLKERKKERKSCVFPHTLQSGKLPECIIYIKPSGLERSVIVGFLAMRYNTACLVSQPEVLLHLFVSLSPATRLFFRDRLYVSTGGMGIRRQLIQRTIWAQRVGTERGIRSQRCCNICLPAAWAPTGKVTLPAGPGMSVEK